MTTEPQLIKPASAAGRNSKRLVIILLALLSIGAKVLVERQLSVVLQKVQSVEQVDVKSWKTRFPRVSSQAPARRKANQDSLAEVGQRGD